VKKLPVLVVLVVALALPAFANEKDPPFLRNFFAPELVLKHAREIGLTPQQRTALVKDIGQVTGATTELQLSMVEGMASVEELSAADPVSERALLDAIRQVLGAEMKVKEAHMGLLVRVRNLLTPEQREKLTALRGDS
jgi:Spy/CpxP family protein refolding chaperone